MSSEAMSNSLGCLPEEPGSRQRTVAIHTHGCKLNQADSELLIRQFRDAGYRIVDPTAAADIIVLNTCTVTATADAKARQFLRAAKRRNPDAVVVATGCYAQRSPSELEGMQAVSIVVGNGAKSELVTTAHAVVQEIAAPAAGSSRAEPPAAGRTRAMVKIQEGCDQVCAYCIVPRVRGRERSLPPEKIVEEINLHASEGCREVVLTGTQLGSYGFDMPDLDLCLLLDKVLAETAVERIRVSSLQPQEISTRLLERWQDERLTQHFHIPLQSGCDRVLRRMRRRYDTVQFSEAVERVRQIFPEAGITTDLIVGFPGESSDCFRESRDFACAMQFSDIHVFPYSPRPGTSAFLFQGKVDEAEKRDRMTEMLALSADAKRQFRIRQLGSVRPVLWERSSAEGWWTGLTDNYVRVRAFSGDSLGNRITGALLVDVDAGWVNAQLQL